MNKKATTFIIAVVLIAIAVMICVIPRFTKVDVTLNAAKMDTDGNTLGTYEISIHGNKEDYISGKSALDVDIAPFDGLKSFQASTNGSNGIEGYIWSMPGSDYLHITLSAYNGDGSLPDDLTLYFSPDMDRWLLMNTTNKVFYVGSVSGNCTTEELLEYFQSAIPSSWKSDNN